MKNKNSLQMFSTNNLFFYCMRLFYHLIAILLLNKIVYAIDEYVTYFSIKNQN